MEDKKMLTTCEAKLTKIDTRERMRLSHNALVEVYSSGQRLVSGYLRDISQEGLYLFANDRLNGDAVRNEPVAVRLTMQHGQSKLSVDVKAVTVRIDALGLAVRFTHPLQWWPVFSLFPVASIASAEMEW